MSDEAMARARVGSVLNDKWTLEKLLGVGGMGAVYAARHRNGARAAVKMLHAELARHADFRERFLREGYAANKVEHPGAVKVIDDDTVAAGPEAGTAYLVMELLSGESLEDRMARGPPVGERELLGIAEEVLDVLEAAHARGVVHRDLKPENLFLARDEASGVTRVKVLDFGLARLLDAASSTGNGVALGTPSYMSPEQAAGRHDEIDGRADLFALAASGLRVVTGKRVHEGDGPVDIVIKMANRPAAPVRSVVPQVSEAFARVIDRALAFRREDRYPDAAAMRDDVRRAIAEIDARAPTLLQPVPESAGAASAAAPAVVSPPPKEPTIELSAGDFEPREDEAPAKAPPSRMEPSRDASIEMSEPVIPMRRRPSLVPVVAVLFFAGIAAKLAMEAQPKDAAMAVDAEAPSANETIVAAERADAGALEAPDASSRVEEAAALAAMDLEPDGSLDEPDATEDAASEDATGDAIDEAREANADLDAGAAEDAATPEPLAVVDAHAPVAPIVLPPRAPPRRPPPPPPPPPPTHRPGRPVRER